MGAIAGVINFDNKEITNKDEENILKGFKEYKLDEINRFKTEKIFFVSGLQYITKENKMEKISGINNKKKYLITADVILDNRVELIEALNVSKNKPISDTELIQLGYEKWKYKLPQHLLGDFAFVIYDIDKEEIFAARDHVGKRTLYYHRNKENFSFSTVMSPIINFLERKITDNERWLCDFLAMKGVVQESEVEETSYNEIKQIPPGSILISTKKEVKIKGYWEPLKLPPLKFKSHEECIEEFNKVFKEAVSCRLRSDYNIGVLLSGGLDSGSVASVAAIELKEKKKKLYAFSSIPKDEFNDKKNNFRISNEKEYIDTLVNKHSNIDVSYLQFNEDNSYKVINKLLDVLEQPYKFIENSFWVKGILKHTRENGCKVVLNGQFGNSTISYGNFNTVLLTLFKKGKFRKANREIKSLCNLYNVKEKDVRKIISRGLCPYRIRKLFNDIFREKVNLFEYQPINENMLTKWNIVKRFEKKKLMNYPVIYGDLTSVRKEIINPIAFSQIGAIETKISLSEGVIKRDPTRDIRVIEFCLRIPEEEFVENGRERMLVRRAMKGILPDKIRLNYTKRGIQGADWLERLKLNWKDIYTELEEYYKKEDIKKYIDIDKMKRNLDNIGTDLNKSKDLTLIRSQIMTLIFSRFILKKS